MLALLLMLSTLAQAVALPMELPHPFIGRWTMDRAQSKLHANSPLRTSTLQFVVASDSVSITDQSTNAAGQQIGTGTTTFRTDGQAHLYDELMPGLRVVAQWRSSRVLETVLTRPNGLVDHVTYEVSADGQTLTTNTTGNLGSQIIVFRRSAE